MTLSVFISYADEDEARLQELKKHLQPLVKQSLIILYDKNNVGPGKEEKPEIYKLLHAADIVLLLLSPDFISSKPCNYHMEHALLRHQHREARVIPIHLRSVHIENTPIAKLRGLPNPNKCVTHSLWGSESRAFKAVVDGIKTVIDEVNADTSRAPAKAQTSTNKVAITVATKIPPQLTTTHERLSILHNMTNTLSESVYELYKDCISVGSDPENDIYLNDMSVSSNHATLIRLSGANYVLRDEDSTHQTKVNGQQIVAGHYRKIGNGDCLQFGRILLRFSVQSNAMIYDSAKHQSLLYIQTGKEPHRTFVLQKDRINIGTELNNDIRLTGKTVSRNHATLIRLPEGNYTLRDNDSSNGIAINGCKVQAYQLSPLQAGDRILIGRVVLVYARVLL